MGPAHHRTSPAGEGAQSHRVSHQHEGATGKATMSSGVMSVVHVAGQERGEQTTL